MHLYIDLLGKLLAVIAHAGISMIERHMFQMRLCN